MDEPTIIFRDLPDGLLGFTDGTSTIWIDKHLSQVDRRVVIEHELVHYVRGHRGHCLAVHEHGIDRIVASGLIHLDDLGDAAAWSPHPWVIAEELDVHPDTVADRLHALTAGERTALAARLADAHWAT